MRSSYNKIVEGLIYLLPLRLLVGKYIDEHLSTVVELHKLHLNIARSYSVFQASSYEACRGLNIVLGCER